MCEGGDLNESDKIAVYAVHGGASLFVEGSVAGCCKGRPSCIAESVCKGRLG